MSTNPWLPAAAPEPATASIPRPDAPRKARGPLGPQPGVAVPDIIDQLPTVEHRATAALWWMAVHGGAGESTLADLVPGWRAAGHGWPTGPSDAPPRVVLVARSHAAGLRAAQNAARQWAAGATPPVDVLGLVIVADAPGRLPRQLRDLAALVSGGVPRAWHLPWVEAWRLGDDVTLAASPREVRRIVSELSALTPDQGPAAGGAH